MPGARPKGGAGVKRKVVAAGPNGSIVEKYVDVGKGAAKNGKLLRPIRPGTASRRAGT